MAARAGNAGTDLALLVERLPTFIAKA